MAIITNIVNGMTEISASSGKYLTQSYPTNFHEFYSKKMILPDDSMDNYKEVTEAEKTQIETQDAKWEEPSKELIKRWNIMWGAYSDTEHLRFGKFNEKSGFFEGTGIVDIPLNEAIKILEIGRCIQLMNQFPNLYAYGVRTVIPLAGGYHLQRDACAMSDIVVARVLDSYIGRSTNPDTHACIVKNSQGWGYGCKYFKEIKGIFDVSNDDSYKIHFYNGFNYSRVFEKIRIINLNKGIYMPSCFNFDMECLNFMVENAKTVDNGQTITLHPNVYAKVSDELFGKASNKNITIATTE